MYRRILTLIFLLTICSVMVAQTTPEIEGYRNDELGSFQYEREGTMDGNQVRTLFRNNGQVGYWPFQPSGEWPKGSGHSYLDGVAVLIASEVVTPTDRVIHPLATAYREHYDYDPVTGQRWTLEAVPGYMNPSSESPAMSNKNNTWPDIWPRALYNVNTNWDGYWYGYFGRGVLNADIETFFVMDDSKDREWTRVPYSYYPIASDSARGGLGLRVEVRGFQWSHVLAEDIIFWHYDIVNISDHDYDKTAFGFYTDSGVGGTDDSGDDYAYFDKTLDITYAYDEDGLGTPGRYPTGYYGYAYLESPGIGTNGIDDDEDGIIDETRDNNIDDDGDWVPYTDLNGNDVWDADENEPLNDDLGADGVGPYDRQYNGPDEGEGDGVPTHGEPHFDETDITESDMIGLTSLDIYILGDGGTGGGWGKDDESMWGKMTSNEFATELQNKNISMVFASSPFPLAKNKRERFSMALVFGSDLDDLIFNKETVQEIYDANYNFSKPPLKPTLTAIPGDGKVFLYWDDIAEESRDPFMGYEIPDDPTSGPKKDFEGYMIYRSTEPEFNDIKVVTDSKGEPKFWKPIAQFDLIDGIEGPDPVGINGASFWRGKETGLQHSYVDSNVTNGQQYYYAVVSYDMGDPERGTKGLTPSECTKIITEDFAGNIQFIDINCAVVTPNARVAGYLPPEISGNLNEVTEGIGTGRLNLNVLNPAEIKNDASYQVVFYSEGDFPTYTTDNFSVIRTYDGTVDTMVLNSREIGLTKFSEPFDGMVVSIDNDTSISVNLDETGWLVGTNPLNIIVREDTTGSSMPWPSDYEIHFHNDPVYTTPFSKIPVEFEVLNVTTGEQSDAEIVDRDKSGDLSVGDDILIVEYVGTRFKVAWRIHYFRTLFPGAPNLEPGEGDIYFIKTNKPFYNGDKFTFSTRSEEIDNELAKTQLEKIKVVPNPYVAQAEWEKRNLNQTGRGERRIDFIHLPSECTIKIYTVAGALVKTLYKEGNSIDGSISWNLVTEDGMDAAFGLYIYHVDAPGVGEHIGKFALIK
ncbi:MAG: hypothetical protein JW995_15030 [Melioribacteraceae bacterium]|nr:hypothetical protein [Melioribacteraceae bacterium]